MMIPRSMARCIGAGSVLMLTALMLASPGRAESPDLEKIVSIEGVTEHRLPNGLRVLLFPDAGAAKVSVNCIVFAGSRHEGHGETGMAHLLEHMNIKCTASRPDIKKLLNDRGARWNATTAQDRTNYFEVLPASDDNLEFAIALEADRLMNCLIRREDLVSEMTVVRNEFERAENDPGQILFQRMTALAYEWHNYGKAIIGNRSDIERVKVENLRAFYRKHYRPDNAMLIVAGKFDEAKALAGIARCFGPLKNPPASLEPSRTDEPAQDGERQVELRRVGATGQVAAVYHIPAAAHPDYAPLVVLAQMLNGTPHGRLYKKLVATKKSSSVGAGALPRHDPGLFVLGAQVDQGQSTDDVRRTLFEVVDRFATEPATEEEVRLAVSELTSGWETMSCFDLADALGEWAARGDWRLTFYHRDRLAKVTAADVSRVATRYLIRTNRTTGIYVPTEKPDRAEVPQTPDLAAMLKEYKGGKAVASGETFDPTPENIEQRLQRIVLPSGIKAALLPRKTRGETVMVRLTLRYGSEQSLGGLREACEYLPHMMRRGTRHHDFNAIEAALPRLGNASIAASGAAGNATFSVECQRQYLPQMLTLLKEMLREPTFPRAEFETLQRATIESIRGQLKEPGPLGLQALRRTLRPHQSSNLRYITTMEESIAAHESVTVDQIRTLYVDQLSGANGELVVVGDFEPNEVIGQMHGMLSGWTSNVKYARIAEPVETVVAGSRQVILTADKANAVYRAAHLVAHRHTDADYPALVVGNYILGQPAAGSRLWNRLRERDGLSYHVQSSYSAGSLDPEGGFEFLAICNPANMPKVRQAMSEEIARLLRDGVTRDELEAAKKAILAERRLFSDAEIVATAAGCLSDGDSFAAYADRSRKVASLTVEQVNAALRKHLKPEKLVIVEAGDFAAKSSAKAAPSQP